MGAERFNLRSERPVAIQEEGARGFMAVAVGTSVQHPLYQWAYEQARLAVAPPAPAAARDLFAIMN
jgi:hypothetical protein